MRRRLKIGYLNTYTIAPLLVAKHHHRLDDLGWSFEPSMEIGWRPLMQGLFLGKLDGAIVPPCLPFASAMKDAGERALLSASAAMTFGGPRVVCSLHVEEALEKGKTPTRLRFAATGEFGCENFYMRRWLRRLGRPDWVSLLEPLKVAVTQNLNFLEAGVVDLFLCMEPWGRPESNRRTARMLLSGEPFEEALLSRVLVLRNDYLTVHTGLLERLLPILQRSAEWLEEASNQPILAEILSHSGGNLTERELFASLKADLPVSSQCGFSYLRPGGGTGRLTYADMLLGWEIFSEAAFAGKPLQPLPEAASRLFRIEDKAIPSGRAKLA